jgi:hypothetical protein
LEIKKWPSKAQTHTPSCSPSPAYTQKKLLVSRSISIPTREEKRAASSTKQQKSFGWEEDGEDGEARAGGEARNKRMNEWMEAHNILFIQNGEQR